MKKQLDLAKKRTMLACMRTMMSFFRTAVVCLSLAFAFMKLDKEHPIDGFTIALFVISGLVFVWGIVDYFLCKASIDRIDDE